MTLDPITSASASVVAPDIEAEIKMVANELVQILIAKNRSYGNSAARPINIFSSASPIEQIDVRIDDKLKRISMGSEYPGDDTILDLTGYLILRIAVQRLLAHEENKTGE